MRQITARLSVRVRSGLPIMNDIIAILILELAYTIKALEFCKTSKDIEELRRKVLGKNNLIRQIEKELWK